MGLLGKKNGAQGTVLNGVCKCRIGRNGILTEGSNDGVSARIVVQTVIRSLNHFIAAWNIPGISDIVTAVESDVTIVKHAVDDAQVNLAVSGHFDAGDFNLLLRVDILRCGTDQNSSTDSSCVFRISYALSASADRVSSAISSALRSISSAEISTPNPS